MVPKIIHYCWFGDGDMPAIVKKCMKSWENVLPEYKIILWNEDSFDVNICNFTKHAYENKKYAFVSDYVRLHALNEYGGFYLDTDEEILKSLDCFLNHRALIGFDDGKCIISCFMATEKGHPLIKDMIEYYKNLEFIKQDGTFNETPNTIWLENILKNKYDLVLDGCYQELKEGIVIYPEEFFHAKSLYSGKIHITSHTYGIHHHTLLWVSKKTFLIKLIRQKIVIPLIGKQMYINLTNVIRR